MTTNDKKTTTVVVFVVMSLIICVIRVICGLKSFVVVVIPVFTLSSLCLCGLSLSFVMGGTVLGKLDFFIAIPEQIPYAF